MVVSATLVLVAVSWPTLDDGHALLVMRGVAVLLAAACLLSVDDPPGEVLAASPYPVGVRVGTRVLTGLPWVVAVWAAAITLVAVRSEGTPLWGASLEAASLILIGLALAAGLQAWGGLFTPSHAACVALVGLVVLGSFLPRWYVIYQTQVWGPPWEAAHIRWAAIALAAGALLHLALRDPVSSRRPR
jgi:hypothetical protein